MVPFAYSTEPQGHRSHPQGQGPGQRVRDLSGFLVGTGEGSLSVQQPYSDLHLPPFPSLGGILRSGVRGSLPVTRSLLSQIWTLPPCIDPAGANVFWGAVS